MINKEQCHHLFPDAQIVDLHDKGYSIDQLTRMVSMTEQVDKVEAMRRVESALVGQKEENS